MVHRIDISVACNTVKSSEKENIFVNIVGLCHTYLSNIFVNIMYVDMHLSRENKHLCFPKLVFVKSYIDV